MRKDLKQLRLSQGLTQKQIAEDIGYHRSYYTNVETGKRRGSIHFWNGIQKVLKIPDDDMWRYTKNVEE